VMARPGTCECEGGEAQMQISAAWPSSARGNKTNSQTAVKAHRKSHGTASTPKRCVALRRASYDELSAETVSRLPGYADN